MNTVSSGEDMPELEIPLLKHGRAFVVAGILMLGPMLVPVLFASAMTEAGNIEYVVRACVAVVLIVCLGILFWHLIGSFRHIKVSQAGLECHGPWWRGSFPWCQVHGVHFGACERATEHDPIRITIGAAARLIIFVIPASAYLATRKLLATWSGAYLIDEVARQVAVPSVEGTDQSALQLEGFVASLVANWRRRGLLYLFAIPIWLLGVAMAVVVFKGGPVVVFSGLVGAGVFLAIAASYFRTGKKLGLLLTDRNDWVWGQTGDTGDAADFLQAMPTSLVTALPGQASLAELSRRGRRSSIGRLLLTLLVAIVAVFVIGPLLSFAPKTVILVLGGAGLGLHLYGLFSGRHLVVAVGFVLVITAGMALAVGGHM